MLPLASILLHLRGLTVAASDQTLLPCMLAVALPTIQSLVMLHTLGPCYLIGSVKTLRIPQAAFVLNAPFSGFEKVLFRRVQFGCDALDMPAGVRWPMHRCVAKQHTQASRHQDFFASSGW